MSETLSTEQKNTDWENMPDFIGNKQVGGGVEVTTEEPVSVPQTEAVKPLSAAENIVELATASFDSILSRNVETVNKTKNRISSLEQKMADEKDEYRSERYVQMIADAKRTLRIQEAQVEFARIPTVEDVEYRAEIIRQYPNMIKETVPDDLPLVFHGSSNIGQVKEIIRTNGLLTPEQRGESMTSFATQIDVTAKTNVRVSCEFAEPNYHWMPYGAIFAFMPRPEEVDEVNRTGDSSEVFGGVNGVNFKTEPERLYGIITTPENIDRIQAWCGEYGLDKDKVLTHEGFIESMKKESEKSDEIDPNLTIAEIDNSAQSFDAEGLAESGSEGAIVANREQLKQIIDLPALKAVETLYDLNVQTQSSSANGSNFGDGVASITISYDTLSDENKQIADDMVKQGIAGESFPSDPEHRGGSKTISIDTQMTLDSKARDISEALTRLAENFQPQDVLYGRTVVTDEWLNRNAKAYGVELSYFGNTREEQIVSLMPPSAYYDTETGELWASRELFDKHIAFIKSSKNESI